MPVETRHRLLSAPHHFWQALHVPSPGPLKTCPGRLQRKDLGCSCGRKDLPGSTGEGSVGKSIPGADAFGIEALQGHGHRAAERADPPQQRGALGRLVPRWRGDVPGRRRGGKGVGRPKTEKRRSVGWAEVRTSPQKEEMNLCVWAKRRTNPTA